MKRAITAVPATIGQVYSATRIYDTIINEPPYLTQATEIVYWTERPAPTTTA